MVMSGRLDFNPLTDELQAADGSKFRLESPFGDELPALGFDPGEDTYQAPPADGSSVNVQVDEASSRLQLLQPFAKFEGQDLVDASILIKVSALNYFGMRLDLRNMY